MTKQGVLIGNLLRQNRWRVVLLLVWPVLIGAFAAHSAGPADVASAIQQAIFYAQSFLVLIAAVMLGQELRSRRILLPLACNVSRAAYLSAVAGALLILVVLEAAELLAMSAFYMGRLPDALVMAVLLLEITLAALGVFWSTLLRDVFATLATVVSAGVLLGLGTLAPFTWPAVPAVRSVIVVNGLHASQQGFAMPRFPLWAFAAGLGEAALIWIAALALFRRRDIAVPTAD